jgi:DNA polymerase zeta
MGSQKLGWTDKVLPPGRLELLQDHVTISPNGIIYAKQNLRKSLLSKMLGEILETRVMVKNGMKLARGDKVSFRRSNGDTFMAYQFNGNSLFFKS